MNLRLLPWLILPAALLPAVTLYWQNRDIPHFGNLQDDAVYVLTAKGLAAGQGYKLLHLPTHPHQVKYPPLYPAILATMWRFAPDFPANLSTMVAFNLIALAAAVAGVWRLYLLYGFGSNVAALMAAVIASLPAYIYLGISVMTEMPFIAFFVWAFVLLEKAGESGGAGSKWAFAAGLLTSAAYLTRTAGTPLFLTAPLCFVLWRRFRLAGAFLAAAAPPLAIWQVWTLTHQSPMTDWLTRFYLGYGEMQRLTVGFDNLGAVMYCNLDSMLTNIGEILIFGLGHSSWLGHQVSRLLGIATLVGTVRLALRIRRWHYPAFAVVFCGLMIFWHYPPDQRLFVPLAPLFIAGLWTEFRYLWTLARCTLEAGKLSARMVAAAFLAGLCAFGLFVPYSLGKARLADLPDLESDSRVHTAQLRAAFAAIAKLTPKDAVILSDQDVLVTLYTGRTSYRTIAAPRLFYPPRMDLVRNAFADMPHSTLKRWDYALVSRADWRHTLDGEDRGRLLTRIAQRADLQVVWRDEAATLYIEKPAAR